MKQIPQACLHPYKSNAGHFRSGLLRPTLLGGVLLAALLPFAVTRASAQNGVDTWVGNTSVNWADHNWSGANNPPASGDGLTFGAAGTSGASLIDNLTTGAFVITNITYSAAAPSFLITPGPTAGFTLGTSVAAPVIVQGSANPQTNNDSITLGNATQTISLTGNLTLGGNITGTGGLSQIGAGTLTLTGTNTFSGAINGIAGTVVIGGTNGAYAGGFTVNGGGTLTVATNGTLNGGTYAAAINNGGTLNFNGGVAQTLSSIISGAGAVNFSGGGNTAAIYILKGASTFTGNVAISNTYVSLQAASTLGNSQTAGQTYTINSNGTLSLDIGNIFGGGATLPLNTFIINQGGLLQSTPLNSFNNCVIGSLVLNGGTVATVNNAGNGTQYGEYEFGGTLTAGGPSASPSLMTRLGNPNGTEVMNLGINTAAGFQSIWTVNPAGINPSALPDLTCGIPLLNAGNSQSASGILKLGSGLLALTATNTFTGPVTVSNGTFEISGGGLLQSGTVTFNITNEATFEFNSTGNQTFSGAVFQNDGTNLVASGSPNFSGPMTNSGTILVTGGTPSFAGTIMNTGSILVPGGAPLFSGPITNTGTIVANGGSPQFTGAISGTTSITNNGPGTLSLSGANTYTGNTTAHGGLLLISATEPNTAPVFVNDGAVLGILSSGSAHFSPTSLNLGSTTGAVVQLVLSSTTQAQLTPASIVVVGSNAVVISGNLAPNTSYPVLSVNAGSLTGSGTLNFVVPNGVGGSVVPTTAGGVTTYTFNVTTVTATIWDSAVNGTWDINATANWIAPNSGTKYLDNSPVQFDDSNNTGGVYAITNSVATLFSPSVWHVTNNATGYTFSNTVVIAGSTGLTKDGAGSLTIYGTNTYTGPTVINGGNVVAAGGSGAIGGPLGNNSAVSLSNTASAALTLSASKVQIASLRGGGALGGNVNLGSGTLTSGTDNSSQTYGGVISGTGSFTLVGSGTLTLTNSSTFTGTLTVGAGNTLAITNTALGVNNSPGFYTFSAPIVNNGTIVYSSTLSQTNTGLVTGGTAGTNGLIINGPGTFALSNPGNLFTGNIVVNGGKLSATGGVYTGNRNNSAFGNVEVLGRTATVNNGGVLSFESPNVFANSGEATLMSIIINQGGLMQIMAATEDEVLTNVTLNGGTLFAGPVSGNGWWYPSGVFQASVIVGGTSPSFITAGNTGTWSGSLTANGGNGNGFGLGLTAAANYQTPFVVASTGSSGQPDLTVSATLFNSDNDSGRVSGLVKTGAGTMLLSGTNLFSGPITAGAGTLIVGGGGSLFNGFYPANIVISNAANFVFSSSVPQTLTGAISGAGTNTVSGVGSQLTIAGTNTLTGPTVINGGTLFLSGNAIYTNTSIITISNGGVFDISQLTTPLYTLSPTESLIASNVSGTPSINGSIATVAGSKFIVAGTNSAGILNINGSLSLGVGTSVPFDLSTLSTADGGVNDQVVVNGALNIATGNSLTLSALSGAANLDQSSDYILFTGTSLTGGFSPGPIWTGSPLPVNFNHFIVTNDVTHSQVRLTYSSVAVPSISATTTTPASGLLRNQPVLLSATVVPGGVGITGVSINLSSVGGASSVPLTLSATPGVYTNSILIPPGTLPGATLLPVTATDANNNQGSGYVVVSVVASTETWNGGGTAGQENFDNSLDWAIETGQSVAYAPGYVGDSLVFAGLGGTAGFTPVMDNNYTVAGVTFSAGATNFNITPANSSSLTLAGGITNSSTNLQKLAVPIILSGSENVTAGPGGLLLTGAISSGTPTAGLIENGSGTLTLSGVETYTGQTIVNSGTLTLTSSGDLETNDVTILVGGVSNSNAVLNTAGNITNSSIWIGYVSNSVGAVYQTAGNIILNPIPTTGFNDLQIGDVSGSFGYYDAAGGTLNAYGICIGGDGNNTDNTTLEGSGILDINGGIITDVGNTFYTVMCHCTATSSQTAIINVYSGSLIYSGPGGLVANYGTGETSIINVMGGTLADLVQNPINLNESANANTGVLNLISGVAQADSVIGTGGQINFNGGALAPSESIGNFINTGSATLYAKGGVLTNSGYMITNAQPILLPSGNGVTGVTTFTGGAGYIAPPIVVITNGGGTGATAIAQINPATGAVTNILITSPGINYTNSPTFVFNGGGATTKAAVTASTIAPNTSGPMTFAGSGYVILTGASTYTNATIVNGADLQLGAGGSINSSYAVLVTNSGDFDLSLLGSFTLGSGQRFEGSGGSITAPTGGATVTGLGSSIYPGTDGTIGSLTFNGNLTMAIGSTANFDLTTSASGQNDSISVTGSSTLTLNGNAFHIKAPSTSSSLDTSSDYVLITANTVEGGFNPTPVWDVQPVNAAGFRVLTINGNEVVLRYSTLTPPTGGGTATPTNLVRYGTVFISVTVTNGSNPMNPGGTVTVDTTALGGGYGEQLVEVGSTAVYTNTFTVAPTALPASVALPVTIIDSGSQIGVAFIPVNILPATETWNGNNHLTDQNWDDGKNWVSTVPPGYVGDNLVFAGSTGLAPFVDQNYSPNSITFASGAGPFIITNSGGDNLTMVTGSSVTNNSATAETFGLPVTLSGAATFKPVSGNIILSQPVGETTPGVGVLVSAGPGTNVLIANNSYTGGTTINTGGTLLLADPGLLNNGNSTSPITDNGTFIYSGQQPQTISGVISGTGGIAVNGGGGSSTNGFLTLSGANTFTGNITVSNGTLVDAIAEGNGNPVATGLGNAQTAGKTVTIGANGTLILSAGGGNEFGYGGVVPAIAFVINQGGVMEVTSGNVQINSVTLNGGVMLAASGDNSTQYPTYGLGGSVTSGGTAQSVITNLTSDVNRDYVTLGDGAGAGSQTLFNVASTGINGADLAIGAQLTDTGADVYGTVFTGLIKAGAGTMLLTAQNIYQGTTTLSNGLISLGAAETAGTSGPLGNSAASNPGSIVFAGGTLQYSAVNQNDYSGRFSASSNQLVSIDLAGQAVTFATPLASSGGSLTVNDSVGGGTLTLPAVNTYTGATSVSNCTVLVTSTGSIANTTALKISAGGKLDLSSSPTFTLATAGSVTGSGKTAAATIAGGTSISFGSRPVTLNFDGVHPALTISSGTLTLNGNAFTVNTTSPLPVGTYVVLQAGSAITTSGTYTVNGTAIGGANGGTITVSGSQVILHIAVIAPPTVTFSINGNNTSLNISWPSAYLGSSLLYQSNSVGTGLQTNGSAWLVWPGSTTVTNEVIPIGKTNEVFFQLLYP